MTQAVYSPRSLNRILGAFDAIAAALGGLTLAGLSAALEAPKSSLLLLLRPLVALGYLVQEDGIYRLGPTAFRLASNILSAYDAGKLIRPYLEELAEKTKESVCFAKLSLEDEVITYFDSIDSPQAMRFTIPSGLSRPLYTSAAGRLLLAYRDIQWREAYLRRIKIRPLTPQTLTDRAGIRRELDKIRRTGVSLSIDEIVLGSAAIAAPVFDMNDEATGAIVIGAPIDRFIRHQDKLEQLIKAAATRASGKLATVGN